jgi:hypothetical protein
MSGIRSHEALRLALLVLSLVGALNVQAATRTVVAPDGSKAFVMIQNSISPGGKADDDTQRLLEGIAGSITPVPGGGDGKGVKSADGALTLSCVSKGAGVMCTLVIKRSSDSIISTHLIEYRLTGERARTLSQGFVPNDGARFLYRTQDGRLTILSEDSGFLVQYH